MNAHIHQRLASFLFFCLCTLLTFYFIRFLWVAEDAYITFRVIDNFVHGYGLRWNVDERVQAYTHPLWMLLLIPFYAVFGHIFWLVMAISLLVSMAAIYVLLKSRPGGYMNQTLLLLLPLICSKAFFEYINCGLESPLACLLLGGFFTCFMNPDTRPQRLYLLAGLCILVRFDMAVILLVPLVWISWEKRSQLRLLPVLRAWSPLLSWLVFSLFYYGFFLPNTKYAKLDTGIPLGVYIDQGLTYTRYLFYSDNFTFDVIVLALGMALWRRQPRELCMAAGIVVFIVYLICVGGDYMRGRFYIAPFYLSLFLLYRFWYAAPWPGLLLRLAPLVLIALVMEAHYRGNAECLRNEDTCYQLHGIKNDMLLFGRTNALFQTNETILSAPTHGWIVYGKYMADHDDIYHKIIVIENIGMYGYYAGPRPVLIDCFALSDALLARLPTIDTKRWYVGHFERSVPEGYLDARVTGNDSKMEPSLARYYEKLRLVTSGPLWSLERLQAIAGFQLGVYEHWRQAYLDTAPPPQRLTKPPIY